MTQEIEEKIYDNDRDVTSPVEHKVGHAEELSSINAQIEELSPKVNTLLEKESRYWTQEDLHIYIQWNDIHAQKAAIISAQLNEIIAARPDFMNLS
jgi:chromosome segregation ATPase